MTKNKALNKMCYVTSSNKLSAVLVKVVLLFVEQTDVVKE
jgi:hypothetical protein